MACLGPPEDSAPSAPNLPQGQRREARLVVGVLAEPAPTDGGSVPMFDDEHEDDDADVGEGIVVETTPSAPVGFGFFS